jgi:hypothetical protein
VAARALPGMDAVGFFFFDKTPPDNAWRAAACRSAAISCFPLMCFSGVFHCAQPIRFLPVPVQPRPAIAISGRRAARLAGAAMRDALVSAGQHCKADLPGRCIRLSRAVRYAVPQFVGQLRACTTNIVRCKRATCTAAPQLRAAPGLDLYHNDAAPRGDWSQRQLCPAREPRRNVGRVREGLAASFRLARRAAVEMLVSREAAAMVDVARSFGASDVYFLLVTCGGLPVARCNKRQEN